jgi:hypothetical protein
LAKLLLFTGKSPRSERSKDATRRLGETSPLHWKIAKERAQRRRYTPPWRNFSSSLENRQGASAAKTLLGASSEASLLQLKLAKERAQQSRYSAPQAKLLFFS